MEIVGTVRVTRNGGVIHFRRLHGLPTSNVPNGPVPEPVPPIEEPPANGEDAALALAALLNYQHYHVGDLVFARRAAKGEQPEYKGKVVAVHKGSRGEWYSVETEEGGTFRTRAGRMRLAKG